MMRMEVVAASGRPPKGWFDGGSDLERERGRVRKNHTNRDQNAKLTASTGAGEQGEALGYSDVVIRGTGMWNRGGG